MLLKYAPMAELADAPDLGSGVPDVKVQVLFGAPNSIVRTQRNQGSYFSFQEIILVFKLLDKN